MPRITPLPTIEAAPAAAQPLLTAVRQQLGAVPNLFRTVAHGPAALAGYLGLHGALQGGVLTPALRERIALAVAEINGCGYCLSAHAMLAGRAGLDAAEIAAARAGGSSDAKSDVAVRFAAKLVMERGHVGAHDVEALRAAGFDDGAIVEIVAHVALNTLTNYMNEVAGTPIDFPLAPGVARAA
jgi:uncharacterized peroxidase-related enzyme